MISLNISLLFGVGVKLDQKLNNSLINSIELTKLLLKMSPFAFNNCAGDGGGCGDDGGPGGGGNGSIGVDEK